MKSGGRVLIADDHPMTREGLAIAARFALPGVAVVTAGSIAETVGAIARTPIDRLVLLDLHLPDAHGLSGLMTIQHHLPGVPIVVVSASEDASLVEAARAVGAAGVLFKSLPMDEIAAKLREADAGGTVFPDGPAFPCARAAIRDRIRALSPAQRIVLIALADGRANKAIAHELAVTEATIKAHLTAIFRKLGVTNRAQALLAVQPIFGAGRGARA